jgi:hypothetical protein
MTTERQMKIYVLTIQVARTNLKLWRKPSRIKHVSFWTLSLMVFLPSIRIGRSPLSTTPPERHTVRLPSRLEAIIPSGKKKIYDLGTKDISIGGAFIYTKEWYSFPEGTRFIINLTIPSASNKELATVKRLMECTGTMVRSTSEGIAIQCDKECEII